MRPSCSIAASGLQCLAVMCGLCSMCLTLKRLTANAETSHLHDHLAMLAYNQCV